MSRRQTRALAAAMRAAPPTDDQLSAMLQTLVAGVKRRLPQGWDVTLVASRHHGDGRCDVKQATTLPAHVARAVHAAMAAQEER